MDIYKLKKDTSSIKKDDRVIAILITRGIWKIKCNEGPRKDQESYIDVKVVKDYLEVVDFVEGEVPVGKYTPFSPNTVEDVLRLCDQAIAECGRQGLETERGTLQDLRENITRYYRLREEFDPFAVYLNNMEVGETYYCAAVMCLDGGSRTYMNPTSGTHTVKQRAFLDSVCKNVANGCQVLQEKSGDGSFFSRGEINAALLCPHFLADPVPTLARIRRGFLGGLDQDRVGILRQNLVDVLGGEPFYKTESAERGLTGKEKAIVWIRRREGTDAYRDMDVNKLVQIQTTLHDCGIDEIIMFGDSTCQRENLKDLRPK